MSKIKINDQFDLTIGQSRDGTYLQNHCNICFWTGDVHTLSIKYTHLKCKKERIGHIKEGCEVYMEPKK